MSIATIRSDFAQSIRRLPALLYFGWDDIRQQYRRTFLGPLWLIMSTSVWIFGMALVMSALLNQNVADVLPYATAGMFVWTFISLSINDGCTVFINASGLINSMHLPMFFHVLRALIRYMFMYAHYLAVCLALMTIMGHPPVLLALLAIPGILIQVIAAFGFILVMGLTNARYRDLAPITGAISQLMPIMTPIAWQREMLQRHTWIADYNPFYHMIEIVRAPLMGKVPALVSYQVSLAVMCVTCLVGLRLFRRARYRLIFWI